MIRREASHGRRCRWAGIALAGLLCSAVPSDEGDGTAKSVGLLERSEARLAQIDVTVIGPPEVVASLTRDDFKVRINLKKLKEFEKNLQKLKAARKAARPKVKKDW